MSNRGSFALSQPSVPAYLQASAILEETTNEADSPYNRNFPIALERGGDSEYLMGTHSRSPSPRVFGGGYSPHSPSSRVRASMNRYNARGTGQNSPNQRLQGFQLVPLQSNGSQLDSSSIQEFVLNQSTQGIQSKPQESNIISKNQQIKQAASPKHKTQPPQGIYLDIKTCDNIQTHKHIVLHEMQQIKMSPKKAQIVSGQGSFLNPQTLGTQKKKRNLSKQKVPGMEGLEQNISPWSTTSLHPLITPPAIIGAAIQQMEAQHQADMQTLMTDPIPERTSSSKAHERERTRQEKRLVTLKKSDIVLEASIDNGQNSLNPSSPGPSNPQLKVRMLAMRQKVIDRQQQIIQARAQSGSQQQTLSPRQMNIVFDPNTVLSPQSQNQSSFNFQQSYRLKTPSPNSQKQMTPNDNQLIKVENLNMTTAPDLDETFDYNQGQNIERDQLNITVRDSLINYKNAQNPYQDTQQTETQFRNNSLYSQNSIIQNAKQNIRQSQTSQVSARKIQTPAQYRLSKQQINFKVINEQGSNNEYRSKTSQSKYTGGTHSNLKARGHHILNEDIANLNILVDYSKTRSDEERDEMKINQEKLTAYNNNVKNESTIGSTK